MHIPSKANTILIFIASPSVGWNIVEGSAESRFLPRSFIGTRGAQKTGPMG
jgi:hypothetical protein